MLAKQKLAELAEECKQKQLRVDLFLGRSKHLTARLKSPDAAIRFYAELDLSRADSSETLLAMPYRLHGEHAVLARSCLLRCDNLNDLEREFLNNVQHCVSLSKRQTAVLSGLANKAGIDWRE